MFAQGRKLSIECFPRYHPNCGFIKAAARRDPTIPIPITVDIRMPLPNRTFGAPARECIYISAGNCSHQPQLLCHADVPAGHAGLRYLSLRHSHWMHNSMLAFYSQVFCLLIFIRNFRCGASRAGVTRGVTRMIMR